MIKRFALMVALIGVSGTAQSKDLPISIEWGAVLCKNYGDVVVFANTGELMPSCGRLAQKTQAFQLEPPDNGIVATRATADHVRYYVLQASVTPRTEGVMR